jgi:hypothetical protein
VRGDPPPPPPQPRTACRKQLYSDGYEELDNDKAMTLLGVGGTPGDIHAAYLFDNDDMKS